MVNFKTVNRLLFPCSSVGRASGCYRLAASGGDAGVKSGLSQGNRTVETAAILSYPRRFASQSEAAGGVQRLYTRHPMWMKR